MNTAEEDLYSMMILVTVIVREWTALGLCRLSRSIIDIIIIIKLFLKNFPLRLCHDFYHHHDSTTGQSLTSLGFQRHRNLYL